MTARKFEKYSFFENNFCQKNIELITSEFCAFLHVKKKLTEFMELCKVSDLFLPSLKMLTEFTRSP